METTQFYVPAIYYRNYVGEVVVSPKEYMQSVADLGKDCTATELILDEALFDDYIAALPQMFTELTEMGVSVPIVRVLAPSLFLRKNEECVEGLSNMLEAVNGLFGSVIVQLDTLSAWQIFETRNNTIIHPDMVPMGYKYEKYADIAIETIKVFCDICEKTGHTAAIEPRTGHVISNPDSVMRVVEKSEDGTLPFKVIFDVSHMEFQGINTIDAWSVLKDYSVAVHASDTDKTSGVHMNIGSGQIPWRSILTHTAESKEVSLIAVEMLGDELLEPSEIKDAYLEGLNQVKAYVNKYGLGSAFK